MAERKVLYLTKSEMYVDIMQRWLDKGYKVENLALSSCCTQYGIKMTELVAILVKEEQ